MRQSVLFVINSLAGGGAERVFTTILTASQSRLDRFDISVALLDRDPAAYQLVSSFGTYQLDARHSVARSVLGVAGLVRKLKPDVAVSFLTRANVAATFAMSLRGRPVIISERVNSRAHLDTGRHAWASKALVRLTYPRATRVIAVSDGVADTLVSDFGVPRDRIRIVLNPVDVSRIKALAAEPPPFPLLPDDVAATGRLVPNKNFALAIEAFSRAACPGRLIIMGDGPERANLQALGARLGLGDRLVMPGFVANPYPVIAGARYLILSSNAEGFPNALVEALACGVPAIATDCRSGPAQVLGIDGAAAPFVEGSGGLLVPVDDADAMTAAIVAMQDPARRAALAARGSERVKDFGVYQAVESYWSVITEVLEHRCP